MYIHQIYELVIALNSDENICVKTIEFKRISGVNSYLYCGVWYCGKMKATIHENGKEETDMK